MEIALSATELSHLEQWMGHALCVAAEALQVGEVPVGAVFVKHPKLDGSKPHTMYPLLTTFDVSQGEIVGRSHNMTNQYHSVRPHYRLLLTSGLGPC